MQYGENKTAFMGPWLLFPQKIPPIDRRFTIMVGHPFLQGYIERIIITWFRSLRFKRRQEYHRRWNTKKAFLKPRRFYDKNATRTTFQCIERCLYFGIFSLPIWILFLTWKILQRSPLSKSSFVRVIIFASSIELIDPTVICSLLALRYTSSTAWGKCFRLARPTRLRLRAFRCTVPFFSGT